MSYNTWGLEWGMKLGRKSLDYPEVCHNVDVEGLGNLLFGLLQQWMSWHDSSVVDQDRYDADLRFDFLDNLNDLLPAGHVTARE